MRGGVNAYGTIRENRQNQRGRTARETWADVTPVGIDAPLRRRSTALGLDVLGAPTDRGL
jgi:hypothetical protein